MKETTPIRDPPNKKRFNSNDLILKKGEKVLEKKSITKRIGASVMALLCSASVIGTSLPNIISNNTITAEAASNLYRRISHKEGTLGVNKFWDVYEYSLNQYILTNSSGNNATDYYHSVNLDWSGTSKNYAIAAMCLDHTGSSKDVYNGTGESPSLTDNHGLKGTEAKNIIAAIEYFGYPYGQGDYQLNTNTNKNVPLGMSQSYHAATQLLIWQVAFGNRNSAFELVSTNHPERKNGAHSSTDVNGIRSEMKSNLHDSADVYNNDLKGNGQKAYQRLVERVQRYFTTPVWNNKTYKLTFNPTQGKFTTTISDKNTIKSEFNGNQSTTYGMMGLHENVRYEISFSIYNDTVKSSSATGTDGSYNYKPNLLELEASIPMSVIRGSGFTAAKTPAGVVFTKRYSDTLNSNNMQRKYEIKGDGVSNSTSKSSTIVFDYSKFKLSNEILNPTDRDGAQWMWFGNTINLKSAALTLSTDFTELDIIKKFQDVDGNIITSAHAAASGKTFAQLISSNVKFVIADNSNGKFIKTKSYTIGGKTYLLFDEETTDRDSAAISLSNSAREINSTDGTVTLKTLLPPGLSYKIQEISNITDEFQIAQNNRSVKLTSDESSSVEFINKEIDQNPQMMDADLQKTWLSNTMDEEMTTTEVAADPNYSDLINSDKIYYYAGINANLDNTTVKKWYFKAGTNGATNGLTLADASTNLYTMDGTRINGSNAPVSKYNSNYKILNQNFRSYLTTNISDAQKFTIDSNFIQANGIHIQIPESYRNTPTGALNKFPDKSLFIEEHNDWNPTSTSGSIKWTYIDSESDPRSNGLAIVGNPTTYTLLFSKANPSRTLQNAEIYFRFKTYKVEEGTDIPVSGAAYDLYMVGESEPLERAWTDSNGELLFETKMYPGEEYYFIEAPDVDPPYGYKRDETKHYPYSYAMRMAMQYGYLATIQQNNNNFVEIFYSTSESNKDGFWIRRSDTSGSSIANDSTIDPIDEPVQPYPLVIHKTDEFGKNVPNVEFKVTALNVVDPNGNDRYSNPVIATNAKTNSSGIVQIDNLYAGVYQVEEVNNPNIGLIASDEIYTVEVGPHLEDNTADFQGGTIDVVNQRQRIHLQINKENALHEPLSAEFEIRYDAQYRNPIDNTHIIGNYNELVGTVVVTNGTTNTFKDASGNPINGQLTLYAGARYKVIETKAPDGYLPASSWTFTQAATNSGTVLNYSKTVTETRVPVSINIHKINSIGDGVPDAVFELRADGDISIEAGSIWKSDNAVIATATTNSSGNATFSVQVPIGFKYKIVETQAPIGYDLADDVSVDLTNMSGPYATSRSVTTTIEEPDSSISLEIEKVEQGNTTHKLQGAKYKVYANESVIVDNVSYSKDSFIEEIGPTNASGIALSSKRYPVGKKFYLVESTAPQRYVLSTEKKEFTIVQNQVTNNKFRIVQEDPEQTISITALKRYAKIDASGSVVNTTKPLAGAVFTLYATDTVTVGGVVYHAGDVIETSQATGTSGSVTFTKKVPVGHSYEVAETAITSNSPVVIRNTDRQTVYVAASTTSTEPVINQSLTFYNKQTMGVIEAVKVDENNNNIRLNGATFVLKAAEDIKLADGTIWTYNGQQITSGKTIATVTTKNDIEDINAATQTRADGIARFPEVPVGFKYTLEEQTAPVNYVRQNPIETFTFTAASSIDNNSNTVVYRSVFEEHWQKGKISVYKKAIQDGVQSNIPLGGAKFGLYVLSNTVYDPDNPTQVLYTRNLTTPIQIVETNSTDGYAEFDPVPVGYQYRIKEIEPPNNYVNSNFSNDFTLQYAAQFQDIEYITKSFDVYNPYQTAQINVYKKITGKDLPLAGAKFKLEAAETVYKPDGTTVLYNNNQQIGAIQQTGTNGKLTFSTQVPVGYKYRIVEVEAPAGYINNSGVKEFTPTGNKSVEYVTYDTDPIYNPETHISVSKKKATGNEELAGASLEIRYASNNTVVTLNGSRLAWTSGTTPHEITTLPAGNYILHETASPNGYYLTADIPFTLNANGSVTSSTSGAVTTVGGVPTIIMRDNYTRVSVKKVDAGTNNPLPNAKLRIKDKTTGNIVVAEWTTDTTGTKVIEGVLTVGKTYILEETAAPAGYKIAQSKEFTVESRTASQGPQEIVMADDYTTIKFAKADGATNGLLAGAEFEVRAQGSSTAYVYNGITMKWTSTTSAKEFYRLPAGNYVLVEIKAPNGYDLAPDIPFTVNTNGIATSSVNGAVSTSNGVSTITMSDSKNSFGVIKVDQDTNKPLSGAIFGLYDSDDNEIERWTSVAGEVKKFTGLTPGKYIIKELKAPRGYNTAAPYEFTIDNNTGDVTYTFKDNQGFRLPETGGSGTVILFSCAIVLILAGVVYFATRKKK